MSRFCAAASYTILFKHYLYICGSGSVVSIATSYGLDGPGIESRWAREFPHLSRPVLGPIQAPVQQVQGVCRGQRAAEA
jgi:hypothetical protein